MANDLIDRQDAIDAVQSIGRLATLPDNDAVIRMSAVEYVLFNMPSAQPERISGREVYQAGYAEGYKAGHAERKTGKWINAYPDIEPNPMLMYGICSACGFEQSISDKLKYCPDCGARMVQEGEDNG